MDDPGTRAVLEALALDLATDASPEYLGRFVQPR
jgi:hypothetical protein